MRRILIAITCMVFATAAPSQAPAQEDDDPSYLEGLIQDALSDTSREVRVVGFRGALSSNATLERLTIADETGVWLVLEDASLVWSRSALLRGRLDVEELTAGRIELLRLPEATPPPPTPEDAEATPFALPELPISIELEELRADEVVLGPSLLGEEATLAVIGKLSLIDGAADVDMAIRRTDRDDQLLLIAAYANATQALKIDLDFEEAQGGLVSRAAKIPNAPALGLKITGDAPLSDFEATIALSSDGVDRFGGVVAIAQPADDDLYRFRANLDGDVRPLLTADLHPFFGQTSEVSVAGSTGPSGLVLDAFDVATGALSVSGDLAMAPDGLPDRFALNGQITGDAPVRLPTVSPPVMVDDITISAEFDASEGDSWTADIAVNGLERDGLSVSEARLSALGQIMRGDQASVIADTRFRATGVDHANRALARAIGVAPEGRVKLTWAEAAPIDIESIDLRSGDATLTGRARIDSLAEGLPITGEGQLAAADLSRFAAIAQRPLSGSADLRVAGNGVPLSGAFDLTLAARTTNLTVGEPRVDPLLRGNAVLDLAARRDETGTYIEALSAQTPALKAEMTGQLSADTGEGTFKGRLNDLSLIEPKLSGAADVDTEIRWQNDGALELVRAEIAALNAQISASGTVDTSDEALPARGRLALNAADISRLAELLQRPLEGSVQLDLEGNGALRDAKLDGTVAVLADRLKTGIAQVDAIMGGELDLNAALAIGDGIPFVDDLSLVTQNLRVTASSPAPGEAISLTARLSDMALVAPGIRGAASIDGAVLPRGARGEAVDLDLQFAGPSGIAATINGAVNEFGVALDLAIRGSAPLALANSFIAPNSITGPLSFDLRVNGAPALSSVSGQATIREARMALPNANLTVTGLGGQVNLSGARLSPDITGSLGNGGQFRVTGPIALSAPYAADVNVALTNLGLRDPSLYETSVNGTLRVNGPLTGGARIGGALALGRTELRVPSGGASAAGAPDGIRHIAEPSDVRRTRARAGLIETGRRSGPAVAFPLDVTVSAPAQIFVRGRGLDAELGGQLRLGGTTANVAASGVFELIRGRIDVLTKRLDLTEGLIDLRGALDPYLRFVAQTTSNEYTINIVVEGLASEPEVRFTSSPDLPQEEVLAQLLFGRDFSEMSALQAAQLVSAVATLSGRGSGGLQGRLRSQLGLSDFDVTSTDDGATQFSAGAYISDNVYSEIVADSEGNNQINLNLDLSPSLTVKGSAGNDGNTGLGIFFERDY